jgi:hypothetical protein
MHASKSSRFPVMIASLLALASPLSRAQNAAPAPPAPAAPAAAAPAAPNPFNSPEAVEQRRRNTELAAADHQRMMDLLHLAKPGPFPSQEEDPKRPPNTKRVEGNANNWTDGVAGHTIVRSGWGNWANYDLAIADKGTLPDPLVLKNGQPVKDAATWWNQRRPEIVSDFVTEIYGRIPGNTPKVTWEVTETDTKALDGKAVKKTIVGHIDNSRYPAATPRINLALFTPADAAGPVPVMVIIGGGGGFGFPAGGRGRGPAGAPGAGAAAASSNAGVAQTPPTTPARGAPGAGRGPAGPGTMQQLLGKGWGYATFNPGTVQADSGGALNVGIIGLVNEGKSRQPDDWGSLAAWSWGLSRAIDYFETDKSVDAKRLGVEGHSRYGKAAIVAGAFEPRWAIVFSSCSGEGGTKLHRHDVGESVDNVCGVSEYHWMAGNFLKYAGYWDQLPIDQHELIALMAPRPVFVNGGTQDLWSDPVGEFKACVGAGPVYRLLGKKDVGTTVMPEPDVELISGDIGYREHIGGHTDSLDWPTFLKFADKYFNAKPAGAN